MKPKRIIKRSFIAPALSFKKSLERDKYLSPFVQYQTISFDEIRRAFPATQFSYLFREKTLELYHRKPSERAPIIAGA